MTLEDLIVKPLYTKKVISRIEHPKNCGKLDPKSEMAHVVGRSQKKEEGIEIALYILLDPADGVIADCKFQAIAPPLLLAALDCACEVLIRKNYEQARRVTSAMILKALDDLQINCTPVLEAIGEAYLECEKLGLVKGVVTPLVKDESGNIAHNWSAMTHQEKLALIESVIQEDVRPYIELDEGGIDVVELKENEVVISYSGACTTCYSSVGSTLNSIQEIIRSKVHPELTVLPNL